jgi:hypothetical protein
MAWRPASVMPAPASAKKLISAQASAKAPPAT